MRMKAIVEEVAKQLKIDEQTIADARAELEKLLSDDDRAPEAKAKLASPSLSSTHINKAVQAAEQAVDKARRAGAKVFEAAMINALKIEAAEQRLEALKEARRVRFELSPEERTNGLNGEVIDFAERLRVLGATWTKVRALTEPEKALLADLIRWKSEDPTFTDSDNPWLPLLKLYMKRTLVDPGADGPPPPLSIPGEPPPPDDRFWKPQYRRYGSRAATLLPSKLAAFASSMNSLQQDVAEEVGQAEPLQKDTREQSDLNHVGGASFINGDPEEPAWASEVRADVPKPIGEAAEPQQERTGAVSSTPSVAASPLARVAGALNTAARNPGAGRAAEKSFHHEPSEAKLVSDQTQVGTNDDLAMTPEEAHRIATEMYERAPQLQAQPWKGTGLAYGDLSAALSSRLRELVNSGQATSEQKKFLRFCEDGRARAFLSARRQLIIDRWEKGLVIAEPAALEEAKNMGLL